MKNTASFIVVVLWLLAAAGAYDLTTSKPAGAWGISEPGGVVNTVTAGTGLSGGGTASSVTLNSNAVYNIDYQPGLVTAVVNTKGTFSKISKASTVDNIEGSASQFTCTVNPTVTFFECGVSSTCAAPTTIGTVTITASGTVVDGTVNSASITANDYIAWAITAGTCTVLDIEATAQIHSN